MSWHSLVCPVTAAMYCITYHHHYHHHHHPDVLHHQLARLGLPGAALPREDDGLVLSPVPQLMPRPVRQRVAATQDIYPESDTLDTHI